MSRIFMDHASTTPLHPEVLDSMLPFFNKNFGNPRSLHSYGREAKIAIDKAKKTIADILNCEMSEIIFTPGGTAANNLAIRGSSNNKTLLLSKLEHASVNKPANKIPHEYIENNEEGFIDINDLKTKTKNEQFLCSIIYAHNEIGTIQNIPEISEICRYSKIPLHIDACQAPGAVSINVKKLGVDMMTLNSGKIYGPKGIGLLYVKKGTLISPIIYGGGQEQGLWSGTQNIPAIVGFAKALELTVKNKEKEKERLKKLRDLFIEQLFNSIENIKLNGPKKNRLPNNINISLPNIDAKEFLFYLDEAGIACSTGSACDANKEKISKTLKAIGLNTRLANSSLRFSLGQSTDKNDIKKVTKTIIELYKRKTL